MVLSIVANQGVALSLLYNGTKFIYPGCTGGVWEFTESLLESGIYAVVATPEAICGVVKPPLQAALYPAVEVRVVTLPVPGLNIPVVVCSWYDRATRTGWASAEALAGFAKRNVSALGYAKVP